jgi:chemotaxis protein methyltransferase CheR
MGFDAESLGLSDSAVGLLRDLVHERTGLFYDDGRRDMFADRLANLVTEGGFQSFLDYYYFLKYDAAAAEEWSRVMDALSVPETYFWREIDQLRAVAGVIVPELALRASPDPIRIWSVPCASGEEPLTLAMLLDADSWFGRADIELHASDASPAAIARARRRRYRERSFRAIPDDVRARYFTRQGDEWEVDPTLHARVRSWSVVNLADRSAVAGRAACDIILCRNLFIYFSAGAVRDVVAQFAERMTTPGYLCVGASESLLRVTQSFELEEIGGAFVYVKRCEVGGRPQE